MGSQTAGHNLATEQQQILKNAANKWIHSKSNIINSKLKEEETEQRKKPTEIGFQLFQVDFLFI